MAAEGEENPLGAVVPLNMDVDQIENLQEELQVNQRGGQEQPAQQNNGGPPPPNVQPNLQNNFPGNNNWNNNMGQNVHVFPPDRHPKYHDVLAPRGNQYQLQRGQKLVHQCPKYARKRPWR